jgi:hypothetical protein
LLAILTKRFFQGFFDQFYAGQFIASARRPSMATMALIKPSRPGYNPFFNGSFGCPPSASSMRCFFSY